MYKLILASESPRRRQLLAQAHFYFDVISVKVSEIPDKNLNVDGQILDIARRKARAALTLLKSSSKTSTEPFILLSADTEVIFGQAPLGKPQDEQDAFRLLSLLSGKTHEVKTALCLIESRGEEEASHIETTQVVFRSLTPEEIWTYISTKEPMDKAGGYGIQGLGGKFVERFVGSYENVVGLPIEQVKRLLAEKKWTLRDS